MKIHLKDKVGLESRPTLKYPPRQLTPLGRHNPSVLAFHKHALALTKSGDIDTDNGRRTTQYLNAGSLCL
jgi:hypothetical protein